MKSKSIFNMPNAQTSEQISLGLKNAHSKRQDSSSNIIARPVAAGGGGKFTRDGRKPQHFDWAAIKLFTIQSIQLGSGTQCCAVLCCAGFVLYFATRTTRRMRAVLSSAIMTSGREWSTHSDTRRSEAISPWGSHNTFHVKSYHRHDQNGFPPIFIPNLPTRVVFPICRSTGKSFDGPSIDLFPYNLIFKSRLQILIEYVKSFWWGSG